ncbi:MAG: arylsulfatase [Akkermansiaceae bacterium]|nr:arylsulfatase [Akkermansiaceae bacterium]
MKRTISIIAAITSLSCLGALASPSPLKPNIIYILADDLGYGDVQCLNPQRGKIKTPHLDKLASQGMTFTDAHSNSSVCTPTRYGLLTGRYAWRTRLQSNVLDGYVEPLIAADRLTVPSLLKQNGYQTACIGKWHLGFTIDGADKSGHAVGSSVVSNEKQLMGAPLGAITHDGPTTRGFDEFFGFHHARMMRSVFENDRVTQLVDPIEMLPLLIKHSTDRIAKQTTSSPPLFLYLPLNSPHDPILPSKEWKGKSGLGDYGDFVMETDWAVGQVLAAVDQAGIANDTLIIMTSDNGCSPVAPTSQLEAQGHFASAQFRGYKSDIWDGGHRVPFFVRWPSKIKPGSQCSQTICHTDLIATCAELLGSKLPANAGEDSVSILPHLLGKTKSQTRPAIVHHSVNGRFAIRQDQWKLELCAGSGGWGKPNENSARSQNLPPVQLYDLSTDIAENNNVQAEHPEIVTRLRSLLEQYVSDGRSAPGPKQSNDVPINLTQDEKASNKKPNQKPNKK